MEKLLEELREFVKHLDDDSDYPELGDSYDNGYLACQIDLREILKSHNVLE